MRCRESPALLAEGNHDVAAPHAWFNPRTFTAVINLYLSEIPHVDEHALITQIITPKIMA